MLGLGGVLLFTVGVDRVTELVDAATNRASKLRNSLRAEDREGDDEHDGPAPTTAGRRATGSASAGTPRTAWSRADRGEPDGALAFSACLAR